VVRRCHSVAFGGSVSLTWYEVRQVLVNLCGLYFTYHSRLIMKETQCQDPLFDASVNHMRRVSLETIELIEIRNKNFFFEKQLKRGCSTDLQSLVVMYLLYA
jgi:hypothetical protein